MRILILTTFFPPLNSIASLRPYSWAKYWTMMGHEVTVLTTEKVQDPSVALKVLNPGYEVIELSQGRLFANLKKGYLPSPSSKTTVKKDRSMFDVLNRFRKRSGIFNACRMPDLTEIWWRGAWKWLKQSEKQWDLVVSTCGPYTVHILGNKIKRKGLAEKWIADYRDLWSNSYIFPGIFPFNKVENFFEPRLLRCADVITTVSGALAGSLKEVHKNARIEVIENGFDPDDLAHLCLERIFPADEKMRIVYTGTIYPGKQDPSPLFKAIAEISKELELKDLEVIFIGPDQKELQLLTQKYGVEQWVCHRGFVSREESLRMQRDADALLFLPWNDENSDGVLTGKIFEYLFSKTLIIAIGAESLEASQKFIQESGAGTVLGCNVEVIKQWLIGQLTEKRIDSVGVVDVFLRRYERKTLAEKMLSLVCDVYN